MAEPTLILQREQGDDQGTPGRLFIPGGPTYATLELPWRGNQSGVSRIVAGNYKSVVAPSPHLHANVYHLLDTPGRKNVLIHWGSFAGDVTKGFKSNVEGCILVGLYAGSINHQRAVLCTRVAVRRLMTRLNNQPFTLKILDRSAA